MLVLDTDLLTIVQRRAGEEYARLDARLEAASATEVICVTIVSVEEQVRGWLAYLARARNEDDRIKAYGRLHALVQDACLRTILDYDARAPQIERELKKSRARVGTMDLRIAAIALANDATLLSRNLRDFGKVPGSRSRIGRKNRDA